MKQETKSTGVLFLRDLKPEAQALVISSIKIQGSKAVQKALATGKDIQIGFWWKTPEYEVF